MSKITIALAAAVALPVFADAQATVSVQEWPVPWENTRPRDPFVDRQGIVWFVGQTGHYIGRFDPSTAKFRKFDLEPGTGPHNLIVDDAGIIWYAGNRTGHIGRLDPATGDIRKYPVPESVSDPHTLVFDGSGNIWFTAQRAGAVGRFVPSTGDVRVVKMATQDARPYGIVVAGGKVWFNQFGTTKVGSLDPASFGVTDFDLPHQRSRGRRIEVTRDGGVWYVDYVRGKLARLDPATRSVEEFDAPGGASSLPYALAQDDKGRLWYVETGVRPNRLVGFDPATKAVVATADIPSGAGAVRHMVFHPATRSIWFGTDENTIGRARLPQ